MQSLVGMTHTYKNEGTMNTKEQILDRLDALITKADEVLSTHEPNPPNFIGFPTLSTEAFYEWQTQTLSYLTNLLGSDQVYVEHFEQGVERGDIEHVNIGKGIIKAVREDIEGGYLKQIEALVSADIFSDFLEMAEYLLEQGYKDPAASLIGAVLEDGLRKLLGAAGITLKSISSLNHKLADANVYNRLTQKKIQVWNDIRNNADHGKFNEYNGDDVKDMLKGVQVFLEQYL